MYSKDSQRLKRNRKEKQYDSLFEQTSIIVKRAQRIGLGPFTNGLNKRNINAKHP